MPNKFIEYQNLIPNYNVEKYLQEFEKILKIYQPNISLMHLKLFDKNGKNLEFKEKGLALAMHIIINHNFNKFYRKLVDLDLKYNCLINLYKNSLIDQKLIKKFYPKTFKNLIKKIKSINSHYKFSNSIFKNKI